MSNNQARKFEPLDQYGKFLDTDLKNITKQNFKDFQEMILTQALLILCFNYF